MHDSEATAPHATKMNPAKYGRSAPIVLKIVTAHVVGPEVTQEVRNPMPINFSFIGTSAAKNLPRAPTMLGDGVP